MSSSTTACSKGFGLIEVLVAIAIVGILASLAIPSYSRYIARGKLVTAQADIALLSLKFENQYQRMLSYPLSNETDTAGVQSLLSGWIPASKSTDFIFSNVNATAATYTLRATGQGGSLAGCVVVIDHTGNKSINSCTKLVSNSEWL